MDRDMCCLGSCGGMAGHQRAAVQAVQEEWLHSHTSTHIKGFISTGGVGGHQVQVDANVGGTGDSLSSHSTQDRARHTYSDHV